MTEPVDVALAEARRHGCLACGSRRLDPGAGPYTGTLVCGQCHAVHQLAAADLVVHGSPHLVLSPGGSPRSALQVSVERPAPAELAPYRADPVGLPERVVVQWRGHGSVLAALLLGGFAFFMFSSVMVELLGSGLLTWILAGLATVIALAKVPVISRRTLVVQGGRAELGVARTSLTSSLGSSRERAMIRSLHAIPFVRPEQVVLVRRRDPQRENADTYSVLVLDERGERLEIETTRAIDDARVLFRVLLGLVPESTNSPPRALPEPDQ